MSANVSRHWIVLSLTVLSTCLTMPFIAIAAQQPAGTPAAKATGAQSVIRKNMADLKAAAIFDVGGIRIGWRLARTLCG